MSLIRPTLLLAALPIAACGTELPTHPMQIDDVKPMELRTPVRPLPELDLAAPAEFETATFALG